MLEPKVNVLIIVNGNKTCAYKLDRAVYLVGRSQKADIRISGDEVSRIHATLLRIPTSNNQFTYRLIDGDARAGKSSQNGTYINGNPTKSKDLDNHDDILFGRNSKAKFFYLSPQLAQDIMAAPERAVRGAMNLQEKDTECLDLNAELARLNAEKGKDNSALKPSPQPSRRSGRSVMKKQPSNTACQLGMFFARAHKVKMEQLDAILTQQTGTKKKLGEILIDHGLASQEEVEQALINQKIHIGDILLNRQLITPEQLKYALTQQVIQQRKLGEILIEMGLLSAEELENVLQEQYWRRNGFWFLK